MLRNTHEYPYKQTNEIKMSFIRISDEPPRPRYRTRENIKIIISRHYFTNTWTSFYYESVTAAIKRINIKTCIILK